MTHWFPSLNYQLSCQLFLIVLLIIADNFLLLPNSLSPSLESSEIKSWEWIRSRYVHGLGRVPFPKIFIAFILSSKVKFDINWSFLFFRIFSVCLKFLSILRIWYSAKICILEMMHSYYFSLSRRYQFGHTFFCNFSTVLLHMLPLASRYSLSYCISVHLIELILAWLHLYTLSPNKVTFCSTWG